GGANAVAVTPDGQRAVSASDDRTVRVWDLGTGRSVATFVGERAFYCCATTFAGQVIAGDMGGTVHFLVLEAGPEP
ncbi:MAG TPA: hypothetical protein VKY74_06280, partial [Chloroflexia bacterium]|nr:hypothetical protein [Chloroflexia bacterium]